AYQAAKTHRLELEETLNRLTADETAAQKALADHVAAYDRAKKALEEREPPTAWGRLGRVVLQMPIIDAFGGSMPKPDQIWLPNLTINYNFRDVARFDRCTTCHLGIDKTAPGSAIEPGYEPGERVVVSLATPKEAPKPEKKDGKDV